MKPRLVIGLPNKSGYVPFYIYDDVVGEIIYKSSAAEKDVKDIGNEKLREIVNDWKTAKDMS